MATTILVVDDDASSRLAVRRVLSQAGYEIVDAESGAEAFRLLDDGLRPAVILLDLLMEDGNGWQFRRRQAAHAEYAAVPVIVISGLDQAPGLGDAAAFVRKPFEVDELVAAIRRCVPPPT